MCLIGVICSEAKRIKVYIYIYIYLFTFLLIHSKFCVLDFIFLLRHHMFPEVVHTTRKVEQALSGIEGVPLLLSCEIAKAIPRATSFTT